MADIQRVFQGIMGKGSIYISNIAAAQDAKLLKKHGIKAILSVAKNGFLHYSKQDISHYLYLPAEDHEEYELYRYFNQTYEFIERARKDTNVLVHCMAGISRSVTIVIAYLLKKYKSSLGEIITMVQRKRNKINPNRGFIEQLKKYAIQQGLSIDFNYEEVPPFREKSNSKGKSKTKILQNSLEKSIFDKLGSSKATIKQVNRLNIHTQKVIGGRQQKINNEQALNVIPLQKQGSIRKRNLLNGQQKYSKAKSIEQKIMRIKQKISKGQFVSKSIEKSNKGKQNQNKSKLFFTPDKDNKAMQSNRCFQSQLSQNLQQKLQEIQFSSRNTKKGSFYVLQGKKKY